jgi:hypothetical protein
VRTEKFVGGVPGRTYIGENGEIRRISTTAYISSTERARERKPYRGENGKMSRSGVTVNVGEKEEVRVCWREGGDW